jgi:uncharacterized cupredoxin-like copper-binding protein
MSTRAAAVVVAALPLAVAIPAWATRGNCSASEHRRGRCASEPRRSRARPPRPAPSAALGVREHEFRISLSRQSVAAGRVIVELDNEGQDSHDLRVAPAGSAQPVLSFAELRAGTRATMTVTLPPGSYRLWCSLPGHDAAGMHAQLRVR